MATQLHCRSHSPRHCSYIRGEGGGGGRRHDVRREGELHRDIQRGDQGPPGGRPHQETGDKGESLVSSKLLKFECEKERIEDLRFNITTFNHFHIYTPN